MSGIAANASSEAPLEPHLEFSRKRFRDFARAETEKKKRLSSRCKSATLCFLHVFGAFHVDFASLILLYVYPFRTVVDTVFILDVSVYNNYSFLGLSVLITYFLQLNY